MSTVACKQERDEFFAARPRALYVHVPFCRRRCRYCDFYSLVFDPRLGKRFVRSVLAELAANVNLLGRPVESIYIGGGTPTALGQDLLAELLAGLAGLADKDTEFTVEANPATIDGPVAALLVQSGVNRVSLGAQSLVAAELAVLGRLHGPEEVGQAVAELRNAGIENLSVDLIYGIPSQTAESWRYSLDQTLSLAPEHLSCYSLSFEEGTPLGDDLAAGRVCEMDEELQRSCYYEAIDRTAQAGLQQYEISNFARPGRASRHNLTYWQNRPYLGIGPGAAGYIDGVRRTNVADLDAYVSACEAGESPPARRECLTGRHQMAEALMLGLRLTGGLDRPRFACRYGQDPLAAFPRTFARYEAVGAVKVDESIIRISREALFVSDAILADIISEV